ncbi:MAG: winged helix-turn-helix transcriptional regulator [Dongiaceae bacterium]
MQGYGQFCPVAKAAEILTERWTPLLLREFVLGSHRFNDLHRGLPLMSRSLLAQRLRRLEAAGIVERRTGAVGQGAEYFLTPAGEEFGPVIEAMGHWGQRWSRRFDTTDLDPSLLVWDMQRSFKRDRLPRRKFVMEMQFRGVPRRHRDRSRWWLIIEPQLVDVCIKDPGFEIELFVQADLAAMTKVWLGDLRLNDTMRAGDIVIEGQPQLTREFPVWLGLSSMANVPRPAT